MNSDDMRSMLRRAREDKTAPQGLTDKQQRSLSKMLGAGCHLHTKALIDAAVAKPFSQWPGSSLIDRIHFIGEDLGTADFCAGQDFNVDMRLTRKALLGG